MNRGHAGLVFGNLDILDTVSLRAIYISHVYLQVLQSQHPHEGGCSLHSIGTGQLEK